ncbi:MAG: cobalt transporter, ATPase subunit [Clostridia bacterium]|jgi:cobalt/nickel transport system ATP-binding protein|nr:cobalt transporter, ATPase subunit [Clostridia bacterium]
MEDYIFEVKDIVYSYMDGTKALRNININIEKGKKIAFIGANGAGKSTLFLHFNGINKPEAGAICFRGKKISYTNSELTKLRKEVGIVFQEPDNQLFSSSVLQEISFGPMNMKLDKETVMKRIEKAMDATAIADLKDKPTHFLSYGQKKRVAIASILAMEPQVLILDEPTSGLDPQNSNAVEDILNTLNKEGRTIIISTHDIDFAYSWADYIYVMNRGEVVSHGTPREVFISKELIEQANIKLPWIVEVYMEFNKGAEFNKESLPKNKEELFSLVKNK